jgi:hypothetical protein
MGSASSDQSGKMVSNDVEKVFCVLELSKRTVTGASYLDMLVNWLMPQLHEDNFIFQQEITSIQIFQSAGLGAQQATTCHSHVGHHKVPIYDPVTIFMGICQRQGLRPSCSRYFS